MSGGRNHNAKEVQSQYFTPIEECSSLLSGIVDFWGPFDLPPKVLEPAAGCGNFIRASQFVGIDFDWTTNDFYPEGNNWEHDYTEDFLSDDFKPNQKFDFIVTNPPFSGKVNYRGMKLDLPIAFIHRTFEFVDRAAMILPANYLRPYYRAQLPKGVRVTHKSDPKFVKFDVAGEEKTVRVAQFLFERTGESERELVPMSKEIPGFRFADNYDEATHAICLWGNAGETREVWPLASKSFACETPVVVDNWDIELYLMGGGLTDDIQTLSPLACLALREAEVHHYIAEWFEAMEWLRNEK